RAQLKEVKPNAAHVALARLEREWPGDFLLVTQNVDDLHERAGSKHLIHMHGELLRARCLESGTDQDWAIEIDTNSKCGCCGLTGTLRPHIVWFGEMPLQMETIYATLAECDLFIAIGTSGQVYPAAGFASEVAGKARTIEVSFDETQVSQVFEEHRRGLASHEVPRLVDELLSL
ncbi:MAG: Sir2 family NAD-dependent protein deacetylase, partial [Bdellovibrionota bacterium]